MPAVARFMKDAAARSGHFDVQMISLCMSSKDETSINLLRPRSWFRGIRYRQGIWEGLPFTHVGAFIGEFEFQRYRPRSALTKLLKDCDLIQVVCGSPAWANPVIGLGRPVSLQVATLARVERSHRNSSPEGIAGWWRRFMTDITARMDDRALAGVDAIQVENPWMLEYVRRINSGRSVDLRFVPPGINSNLFKPLPSRDLSQETYILCVGRLGDSRKNVGMLLEVYNILVRRLGKRVKLILAGMDSPPDAFWQRANSLGLEESIEFIPNPTLEQLIDLYQHAGVFALPSFEEGLGLVVLEAMGCGIPVVATRCGGPEGIITDGVDGFLVPLNDADAMAERLEYLLGNHQANLMMGKQARKTIEMRFDERVTAKEFVDTWENLLTSRV